MSAAGSGDDLRAAASAGDHVVLKKYLINRPNTCSSDEHRLTPLHYAVWNGHVECVKLLISNSMGIDYTGVKCSSVNLVSTLGYSALHLVALDSPKRQAREIAVLLLIAGSDVTMKCGDGRTAREIAQTSSNSEVLEAFEEYDTRETNKPTLKKYEKIVQELKEKYCFQINTNITAQVSNWDATFAIPRFLFEFQRVGNLPEGMTIHEHQLKPLMEEGNNAKKGIDSIHCLEFVADQAKINKERRMKLVAIGETIK